MKRHGPRGLSDLNLRILLGALGVFDLVLGAGTLLWPDLYMQLVHPELARSLPLLPRTAALWLFFALAEGTAAYGLRRDAIVAVAALRLMDVAADLVYRFTAPGLGPFGQFALLAAPVVNLGLGVLLWREARRRPL